MSLDDVKTNPTEAPLDWYILGKDALFHQMQSILYASPELFDGLSHLRNFINRQFPTFEFYQEDVWNEKTPGETHFESILRCRRTLYETEPFACDIYQNHQDSNGVWHLDDYQKTVLLMPDTRPLIEFLFQYRP